jgi:hypothetical protein
MSSAPLRPDQTAPAPSLDLLPAASQENRTKPAPLKSEGALLSTSTTAPQELSAPLSTGQAAAPEPATTDETAPERPRDLARPPHASESTPQEFGAPLSTSTTAPQEVSTIDEAPPTRPQEVSTAEGALPERLQDLLTTDEAPPETFLEVSTTEGAFPATPQTLAEAAHAPGEACCGTCARFATSGASASARDGTHDPQSGETSAAETTAPRAEKAPLLRAEPGHLTLRVSWLRNQRPPEEHRPQQASLIVGRKSPPADIAVNNDTLSRQQLKLSFREGNWWVEDLQSSCGTWFHFGEKISRATPVPEGARICCGDVELSLLPDEGTR